MKINYDGTTKKATVSFSVLDRIINLLIVLVIAGAVLYGVFKPDLKSLIPPRPQEEVTFSEGSELQWSEYKTLIGNKKLLKKYRKQKSIVSGYIASVPEHKVDGYYKIVVFEDERMDNSAIIIVKTNDKDVIKEFKPGYIVFMEDIFYVSCDGLFLYAQDPVVVSN